MKRISLEGVAQSLGETRLLKTLSEEELKELAAVARKEHVGAGAVIFRKGAPGTSMYMLVDGRVKITTSGPTGNELLLALVDPGELFGEIAAVDGGPRTVNAIAVVPSSIVAIDRRFLTAVLGRNTSSARALSEALCVHLRTAIANVEKIALLDAQTRLWARLIDLGRRYAPNDFGGGPLRIEHGLSQQSLADSIGVTRVMVNRQLSSWREAGLIEDGRGFIVIRNPEALERFVQERRTRSAGEPIEDVDSGDD